MGQHGPSVLAYWPVFGECCIINPTLIGLRKHLVIGELVFLCDFYWSLSVSEARMTLVSFVKTMESCEGSIGYHESANLV